MSVVDTVAEATTMPGQIVHIKKLCFNCDKKGHLSRVCRSKEKGTGQEYEQVPTLKVGSANHSHQLGCTALIMTDLWILPSW
ncbi:hypothetical protein HOLleu_14690 [Holothuria leucospilota]|uniref:CCHC-type domain-containing protein n=1 Tax=Holothuria leucospilota TaxID=206669 RepID=A0A9Q1HCJ7_HOLLE|nr:hypothetical protein HOLleu_14690 [Holothuria leucospilota]